MQTFNISPLFNSSSAPLDRVWDRLNTTIGFDSVGWPEYDLLKTDENEYRISLAVPGFAEADINIEVRDNQLWITGRKEVDPNHNQYLYQGMAKREFQRTFQLPEHVKVTEAHLEQGLLHIDLVREVPEELKPRRIEIRTDNPRLNIENKSEAA